MYISSQAHGNAGDSSTSVGMTQQAEGGSEAIPLAATISIEWKNAPKSFH